MTLWSADVSILKLTHHPLKRSETHVLRLWLIGSLENLKMNFSLIEFYRVLLFLDVGEHVSSVGNVVSGLLCLAHYVRM